MRFELPFLPSAATERRLTDIDISDISGSPFQPRRDITDSELLSLSKSIAGCGVLQPPVVRPYGRGYQLICGERRVKAAQLAGLRSIPCVVAELDDKQAALAALTENLQRRELNCFQLAEAYRDILSRFSMTQSQLAVTLGISQPAIANKLRLLGLDKDLRDKLISAGLTERHARALLSAPAEQRTELLEQAAEKQLTAEHLEKLIAESIRQEKRRRSYRRRAGAFSDVRLFINTIERAVEVMQLSGVAAMVEKNEEGEVIEYIIRIPNGKRAGE